MALNQVQYPILIIVYIMFKLLLKLKVFLTVIRALAKVLVKRAHGVKVTPLKTNFLPTSPNDLKLLQHVVDMYRNYLCQFLS